MKKEKSLDLQEKFLDTSGKDLQVRHYLKRDRQDLIDVGKGYRKRYNLIDRPSEINKGL